MRLPVRLAMSRRRGVGADLMDADQQRGRRIRFREAQRAELRKLLHRAEKARDEGGQRILLEKIAWLDRQLEDLNTVDDRKAA